MTPPDARSARPGPPPVRGAVRGWPVLAFVHRWLGIAGCLLFLLWFVSGIAMIYVRMPELGEDERLAAAPFLRADAIRLSPRDAAERAGVTDLSTVELRMLDDRPVYRFGGRVPRVVYADRGDPVRPPAPDSAAAIARAFVGDAPPPVRAVERLDVPDQWTLQLGPHFPLQRVVFDDAQGTAIYVSGATAEVVLDTTRRERLLAYLGPVAHWLYLPVIRRDGAVWTQVILWTSGLGLVLCASGLLAGVLRVSPRARFRVRRQASMTPYDGWLRWHHYAGLLFGVVTFTWTFSGLLSMGPFPWLSHDGLGARIGGAVSGRPDPVETLPADEVRAAAAALGRVITVKEMRLIAFQGQHYWLGAESAAVHRLAPARDPSTLIAALARDDVEAAARSAASGAAIELAWLTAYDEQYYDPAGRRPLPVLRGRLADATATWFYLDPARAEVVLAVGSRDRLNRWLYHGLHSLDPAWLRNRRPLRDVVMIVLSLGGLAGVASSLAPGWRRLRGLGRR